MTDDRAAADRDLPRGDLRVAEDAGPLGLRRGTAFTFTFADRQIDAYPGETIGAALLAAGIRTLRSTRVDQRPRGLFCGIGTCFDCLVRIDGARPVRACLTPAAPGQRVDVGDDEVSA